MQELYRSENLLVRRVPAWGRARWVVTFDNHSIGAGFDRPGFAEKFLRSQGIAAIHVMGRGDDWYQYPDILEAAATVRAATRKAKRVLAYGSSMGGYAAIRYADAVGANAVLALSPQYTVDPARVPWEKRWQQDGHRIDWRADSSAPLQCECQPIIVYDPTSDDGRHAALIAAEVPSQRIALPYSSHPVSTFLSEIGLLRPLVYGALDEAIDIETVVRDCREARSRSSIYLSELAERQPPHRLHTAIALARKAVIAAPRQIQATTMLALLLSRAGAHDEALTLHRNAVKVSKRNSLYLIRYADSLVAAGKTDEAVAIAAEVIAALPEKGHLRHWHAWVLWKADRHVESIAAEQMAITLEPSNDYYATTLKSYRRQAEIHRLVPIPAIATPLNRTINFARGLIGK